MLNYKYLSYFFIIFGALIMAYILNENSIQKINHSKTLVTTKKDFYKLYHEFQNYHIYILDINHHIQDKARLIDFIK